MAAITYPSPIPQRSAPQPERHLRLIQGGRAHPRTRTAPGVYSRRRLAALVVAAVVVLLAVVTVDAVAARLLVRSAPPASAVVPAATATAPAGAELHVVQPGETLWAIAGELTPEGGDVRATVDRLAARNGGVTSLQVGQRLVLD